MGRPHVCLQAALRTQPAVSQPGPPRSWRNHHGQRLGSCGAPCSRAVPEKCLRACLGISDLRDETEATSIGNTLSGHPVTFASSVGTTPCALPPSLTSLSFTVSQCRMPTLTDGQALAQWLQKSELSTQGVLACLAPLSRLQTLSIEGPLELRPRRRSRSAATAPPAAAAAAVPYHPAVTAPCAERPVLPAPQCQRQPVSAR